MISRDMNKTVEGFHPEGICFNRDTIPGDGQIKVPIAQISKCDLICSEYQGEPIFIVFRQVQNNSGRKALRELISAVDIRVRTDHSIIALTRYRLKVKLSHAIVSASEGSNF